MRTVAGWSNRIERPFLSPGGARGGERPGDEKPVAGAGAEIVVVGPREFDRTIRGEIAKWDKLVKTAGITAE
jgi:hypothetical protein